MSDEPEQFRPPPDPMDRLWIHPSELGPRRDPVRPVRAVRPFVLGMCASTVVAIGGLFLLAALHLGRSAPGTTRLGGVTVAGARLSAEHGAALVTVDGSASVSDAATHRGAGIAVGNDTIVTSASLVASGSPVRVNGAVATAVTVDVATNIAVLRAPVSASPALLAPTTRLSPGDRITVVTRTSNAEGAVIAGDRTFGSPGAAVVVSGLVETSVRPVREMTGSAVVDRSGAVVGIVSGLRAPSGGVLIIPIAEVRDVLDQVRRTGTVRHGWLGLGVVDATTGPLVQSLAPGGPADRGGLAIGDTIAAFDGSPVTSAGALLAAARGMEPGSTVTLQVERGGRTLARSVQLAEASAAP